MRFKNILFAIALSLGSLLGVNAQQYQSQTAPLYATNAKYANGVSPGYAPTAGSGLTLNLSGGTVNCNSTIVEYSGGTLTCSANNSTNYVYLNTSSSCVPAYNTSGFTSVEIPLAKVITSSGVITSIDDVRSPFSSAIGASSGTDVNLNSGSTVGTLGINGYMPQVCVDTSGSDTAQVCNTAITFTPQAGNCIVYQAGLRNSTNSLSVNVNGLGNKDIAIAGDSTWPGDGGGNGWTTFLPFFYFPQTPVTMCYDGVNWNVSGTGILPGGYLPGFQITTTQSALTVNITGGWANCNGTQTNVSPSGIVTLLADSTNYIYLDTSSSCAISSNTSGFSSNIPLYVITTNLGIILITDERTMFGNNGLNYPAAGVPCSTGSAWCSSYTVGIGPNDLVQLNGSSQLPAVSGALLTNLPFESLSTIGSSGAATLIGGVLNIPNYSSGSGSGNIPSNAIFVFTGTSMNFDDSHVLSTAVTITGWTTSTGVTTVTNSGTNNFSAGQWVDMVAATSWPVNGTYNSGTGTRIFQVLSSGLSSTQFEINTSGISAGSCASTCGSAYSASAYLPYATTASVGMPTAAPTNTYAYCSVTDPSGHACTLYGIATNYTNMLHSISPVVTGIPGYLIINGPNNDLGLNYTLTNIETYYQTIFADAHTDGWTVMVGSPTGANINQSGANNFSAYQSAIDEWLRGQGKTTVQAATPGSSQYWDLWTDVGNQLWDGSNTDIIASNTGLGPDGAKMAALTIATDLENGNGRPLPRRVGDWWTQPVGAGSTGNTSYVHLFHRYLPPVR